MTCSDGSGKLLMLHIGGFIEFEIIISVVDSMSILIIKCRMMDLASI